MRLLRRTARLLGCVDFGGSEAHAPQDLGDDFIGAEGATRQREQALPWLATS